MTPHKIIVKADSKTIIVDGKEYKQKSIKYKKIEGVQHQDAIIFEEINKKEHNKKLSFIKNNIKKAISKDDILVEILKGLSINEINRIFSILKTKKPKITKQKGCLGIKIDGGKNNFAYIELFS